MAKPTKWRAAAYITFITLGLCLLLEGLLRVAVFRCTSPEPNLCTVGAVSYRFNHGPGGGDLVPDQDGVWAIWPHRPYHVQTNSEGLRNEEEVDPGADVRILAVGDSFTFGPYVPNEDTWPGWLEHLLDSRPGASGRAQVLNAGVAGYTIQDEYYYLAERGLPLQPDVVVLAFFPNDIGDFNELERALLARDERMIRRRSLLSEARSLFERLESRLAVVKLAVRLKRRREVAEVRERRRGTTPRTRAERTHCDPFFAPAPGETDLCWERYALWLKKTVSLLRDNDAPFLLVAIPDNSQVDGALDSTDPQDFVARIAAEEQAPFLDLLPRLQTLREPESLYLQRRDPKTGEYVGNAHLSAYGYRQVAAAIAEKLDALGLLAPR